MSAVDAEWLLSRFGRVEIFAQGSSRIQEDTTATEEGGLPEKRFTLARFLRSTFLSNTHSPWNYVKLVARNADKRHFEKLGQMALTELSRALRAQSVAFPRAVTWSLWLGAQGSTTAMHIDYQQFNVLFVVSGAKRLVLIDPSHQYPCRQKPRVRRWDVASCWSGVDVLSNPPRHAKEVVLRAGEALVIPEHYWHAAENLEPTIALGMNSMPDHQGEVEDEGERR